MATQAEIGAHLDLSQGAVSQFLAEIGMERDKSGYDLAAVRIAYIRRLREKAAGRSGDDAKLNLVDERARLAALQVEALSLKNALAKGELLPAAEVNEAIKDANARVRARLLAIPPRAAPIVAAMSSPVEVQAKLTEFAHEALAELAGTEVIGTDGQEPRHGGGSPHLGAGVHSAAAADSQPVGRSKPRAQQRGQRRTGKVVDKPG